jgi:hypothetical protein
VTTGRQALTYAEQNLGVHKVYEEAQRAQSELTELRNKLVTMRHEKRVAELAYADAELDYYSEVRAELADMSQAQFDKHIKVAINKHPELRAQRGRLAELAGSIDSGEAYVAHLKGDLEVALARMTELGGYFAYLAAVKEAETARLHPPRNPAVDGEDWPPASAVAGATPTPATPTTPAN